MRILFFFFTVQNNLIATLCNAPICLTEIRRINNNYRAVMMSPLLTCNPEVVVSIESYLNSCYRCEAKYRLGVWSSTRDTAVRLPCASVAGTRMFAPSHGFAYPYVPATTTCRFLVSCFSYLPVRTRAPFLRTTITMTTKSRQLFLIRCFAWPRKNEKTPIYKLRNCSSFQILFDLLCK